MEGIDKNDLDSLFEVFISDYYNRRITIIKIESEDNIKDLTKKISFTIKQIEGGNDGSSL